MFKHQHYSCYNILYFTTIVPAPHIITHPTDTSAVVPFSAVFTCSASGYGDLNIIWYRNNLPLPVKAYSTQVHQPDSTTTSRLIIPNVGKQDVGEYYCLVWTNNKKASRSRIAKLFIAGESATCIFAFLIYCQPHTSTTSDQV